MWEDWVPKCQIAAKRRAASSSRKIKVFTKPFSFFLGAAAEAPSVDIGDAFIVIKFILGGFA